MKTRPSTSLLFAVGFCACVFGFSPAHAQNVATSPTTKEYVHSKADGTPDPGTNTANPDGSITTTYGSGWTETAEIDPTSQPPGGLKRTLRDTNGRIREITRTDGNGRRRYHMILVEDDPVPGTWTKYQEGHDRNGRMNVAEKEETKDGKRRKTDWDFDKGAWKPWSPWIDAPSTTAPAATAPTEKKS